MLASHLKDGSIIFLSFLFQFLIVPGSFANENVVSLKNNEIKVNKTIDIRKGFSFRFRTCGVGTIILGINSSFFIQLLSGERFIKLSLTWKYGNSLSKSVSIEPFYSLDSNIDVKVNFLSNKTGYIFSISPNENVNISSYHTFVNKSYFENFIASQSFNLGSKSFAGCIYSGNNIEFDITNKCELDFGSPCESKGCPAGFTGRYCDTNINDCDFQDEECLQYEKCIDLINDFKCICKNGWTGRLCNIQNNSFCDPNPCKNNGLCKVNTDATDFTCVCPQGYTGRFCETKEYPCLSSPCQNNGTCSNTSTTSYECKCIPGFRGLNCEVNKNDCVDLPCGKGGRCIDGINNYTCDCTGSGLQGRNCKIDINECKPPYPNPCKNNATCENKYSDYRCYCLTGFTGKNCDTDIDDCVGNPCGNGVCQDKLNDFSCVCNSGFTGESCQTNIDDCKNSNCSKNSVCVDLVNTYSCNCSAGFSGKFCEEDINDCEPNPCQNNGTCTDGIASYSCNCSTGFTGKNCTTNIDDCKPNPCVNGECVDLINDYRCNCSSGYKGENCETNINDCTNTTCLNYGTCIDGVNNYTCSCIPSFTGRNCETYQNPCIPNPCKNNGVCLNNTTKGFKCNCSEDYGGNTCSDEVGFCFPKSPCVHGVCSENNQTYSCKCEKGYEGKNCSDDIDECNNSPCLNKGVCVNTDGSFYCNCSNTGYEGVNCSIDINECKNEVPPCSNNAECKNDDGGFFCKCVGNFVGPTCDKRYYVCSSYKVENGEDFCFHNSTCVDLPGFQKKCTCAPGYEGVRCKINIDECKFGFCVNSTNCTDLVNDYSCTCIPGFTGKNCSIDINECEANECKNNATCVDLINKYECDCKAGFNGTFCENDIDWCSYQYCKHGSNCTDIGETYTCDCLPGFSGKNCSNDYPDCDINPCTYEDKQNNMVFENTCVERSNITAMKFYNKSVDEDSFENRDGYICICDDGLEGRNCSINPNNCDSSSCLNNGTCIDLVNDFRCNCTDEFVGKRCETVKDLCFSSPCFNNATCRGSTTGFNCICKPGFGGRLCNESTIISLTGEGYWLFESSEFPSSSLSSIMFRFITTLTNMILMQIHIDGKLYKIVLFSSKINLLRPDNTNDNLFSGLMLNNKWKTIGLRKDSEENSWQIFVDDNERRSSISLGKSIQEVKIGGGSNGVKQNFKNFTGCMGDIQLNGITQVPKHNGSLVNVVNDKCQRKIVCSEDACNKRGKCQDLWITKKCNCDRQYFGKSCESEIKAFGFRRVETPQNVTVKRRSVESQFVRSDVNQSLYNRSFAALIRTRQIDGIIALLISKIPTSLTDEFEYILLSIENGYLTLFKATRTSSGRLEKWQKSQHASKINNGQWNEIEINNKMISINSNIQALTKPFDPFHTQSLFIGGLDPSNSAISSLTELNVFDGCIQAVTFGDTILTNQLVTNASTLNVSLTGTEVGCTGRNGCSNSPCLFDGVCNDLWDEFNCSCKEGFSGKDCGLYGCRISNPCSSGEQCVDIKRNPGQVACSTILTYNGVNSTTTLLLNNVNDVTFSFDVRTRQSNAFIMGVVKSNGDSFLVGLQNNKLLMYYSESGTSRNVSVPVDANGSWMNISVVNNASISSAVIHVNSKSVVRGNDVFGSNWTNFIRSNNLTLGFFNSQSVTNLFMNTGLQGCLTNILFGGTHYNLQTGISANTASGCSSSINSCSPNPCENNRNCIDNFNDFRCECGEFYFHKTCNETVNITCDFNSTLCRNEGSCVTLQPTQAINPAVISDNGVDLFRCDCAAGFNGTLCDSNINECSLDFCKNSVNCTDTFGSYSCLCKPGYTSKNCSENINECEPNPCSNGGTCTDLIAAYNCSCTSAWKGATCTDDVDECEENIHECKQNSTCHNLNGGYKCNCTSGTSGNFCQLTGDNDDDDGVEGWIIGVAVAGGLLVIFLLLLIIYLCCYCRRNSGMEGTYSPNKEEQQSGNVEMNTLKKPNAERLI